MYEVHIINNSGLEDVIPVGNYPEALFIRTDSILNNDTTCQAWISSKGSAERRMEWSRYAR